MIGFLNIHLIPQQQKNTNEKKKPLDKEMNGDDNNTNSNGSNSNDLKGVKNSKWLKGKK